MFYTFFQKDSTIRELTDRLYFGAEKFQEYLKSPKHHQNMLYDMHRKHMRRTRSQPANDPSMNGYQIDVLEQEPRQRNNVYKEDVYPQFDASHDARDLIQRHPQSHNSSFQSSHVPEQRITSVTSQVHHSNVAYDDSFDESHDNQHGGDVQMTRSKTYESSSSPNNDSAIDNNSPSSDSSDRASDQQPQINAVNDQLHYHSPHRTPQLHHHSPLHHRSQHLSRHASENVSHHSAMHSRTDREDSSSRGRFHSIRLSQEAESSNANKHAQQMDTGTPVHCEIDAYSSPIDLEAMEYDANLKHWPEHKKLDEAEVARVELEPYCTQKINGVSVSQI